MPKKPQNDFEPDELIKASADHEKSLAELQAGLKKIEKRVGDSEKLALSFKDAFENDKRMDKVLTDLLVNLIKKDDAVRQAVQKAVSKVDRDWQKALLKKVGFGLWTLIVAAVSGGVVLLIVR